MAQTRKVETQLRMSVQIVTHGTASIPLTRRTDTVRCCVRSLCLVVGYVVSVVFVDVYGFV